MREHHRKSIDNFTNFIRKDKRFLALIIAGSIGKGTERKNSDIDVYLIATDEEYKERAKTGDFHYYNNSKEICCYEGGYIDGKIIDYQFVLNVENHGSEVARSAFVGAFVSYSKIEKLGSVIKRIPKYKLEEKSEKIYSFISHLKAAHWYIGEAEKRNDMYLLLRNATNMVLFGSRLILAYNEKIYRFHKWLMDDVSSAPKKPNDFMELSQKLLKSPSSKNADSFLKCVIDFADWSEPPEGWAARFISDTEWNWRNGKTPIEDR
jgi:hypothetical protein